VFASPNWDKTIKIRCKFVSRASLNSSNLLNIGAKLVLQSSIEALRKQTKFKTTFKHGIVAACSFDSLVIWHDF
jgi:hypothetical protein